MPSKLLFCPRKIRNYIKQIENKYGKDILSRSSNLYFYCFSNPHSSSVADLVEELKARKMNLKFPFAKFGSNREWGMIYVFLLDYILRDRNRDLFSWEDIVFITQLTYVTGFLCDHRTSSILKYMVNNKYWDKTFEDQTLGIFRKQFKFAMRHTLLYKEEIRNGPRNSVQNEVVSKLIQKRKKFIEKYLKDEKVELMMRIFIKHSLEVSIVGYDASPLLPLKKLISSH